MRKDTQSYRDLMLNKSCRFYIFITSLCKPAANAIMIIYFPMYKKIYIEITSLLREGVVRPCRIGEDGKPEPIEHVLELQNELPKQQYGRKDSDSE